MSDETQMQEAAHDNHHSDEVTLPVLGKINVPGGIYTVVLGVLGVLTLIEASLTTLPENVFIIVVLVALSLTKAYLVVMFYMHLQTDNKIFRLALIFPLIVVLLSIAYLIFVPRLGGLGYF